MIGVFYVWFNMSDLINTTMFAMVSLLLSIGNLSAEEVSRADWGEYFKAAGVEGSILIVDERGGKNVTYIYIMPKGYKRSFHQHQHLRYLMLYLLLIRELSKVSLMLFHGIE